MPSALLSPSNFQKTTLSSGLRVLTERHEDVHSATIGVWIEAGSIYETSREAGLAHLLEHMVFKGTKRHSMTKIATRMDELGGGMNAFTEREHVCYHVKVLAEDTKRALELLSEFVTSPVLDPNLLEIEKSVVLEEIRSTEDAPEELVEDLFIENLWAKSRWGRPIIGWPKTVEKFTSDDLRAFMKRHYTPKNCLVVAVGDVQHEEIVQLAEKLLSDLPGEGKSRSKPPEEPAPALHRLVKRADTESAHLVIGAPSFGYNDSRRHAAGMLDSILTGGYSSRLFQEVLEKRGLCYSIGSAGTSYQSAGFWAVATSVAPQNAAKTAKIIAKELRRMKTDGVKRGELKRAKQMARINVLLSEESSSAQMGRIARNELYFGQQRSTQEVLDSVEKVTVEDILQIANDLFDGAKINVAALGPFTKGEKLEIEI